MSVSAAPCPTRVQSVESAPSRDLFERARDGDLGARDRLVRYFMPLARKLALRYSNSLEDKEDLLQVANLGLVKAVRAFDPDRGLAFSTFAIPTISGEIKRHFRDRGWAVHMPRSLQERCLEVDGVTTALTTELGRAPSVREVARFIGSSDEQVLEAMEAEQALGSVSLDVPTGDGEERQPMIERLGGIDGGFAIADELASLAPAWTRLKLRERHILHMRFAEDKTQSEIASKIGVSQMHVSRLLRRALNGLRESTI